MTVFQKTACNSVNTKTREGKHAGDLSCGGPAE